LEAAAKLFFGELSALADRTGHCWAGNAYFADLYSVDDRTVRRWLSALKAEGFIKLDDRAGQRFISITGGGQKCPGGRTKMSGGADKNVRSTTCEKRGNELPLQGVTFGTSDPISKKITKEDKEEGRSPVQDFVKLWFEAFEDVFGERYAMAGGKDGSAAKRLLATTELAPDALVMIARQAWVRRDKPKCFNCRAASSIAGFAAKFNEIKIELRDAGAIAAGSNPKSELNLDPCFRGI
jgi:hypothetical protein